MEDNHSEKSEFSEFGNDELIHVKKIPPKEEDSQDTHLKMLDFDMNFDPNAMWGEIKGEVTHQYLKFVNAYLVERLNLIKKINHFKSNIQREIELLQVNDITELIKIPNIPINKLNHDEINQIDTYLKLQHGLTNSKIEHHKNKLENTEIQHQEKELEVEHSRPKHLTEKQIVNNSLSELDSLVKEELEFLIKKYGMKELTYAVDVITSSKLIRNNRELE